MPKIRLSFKHLRVAEWRPWQKEVYIGIHTGFNPEPVMNASWYPVTVYATIKPCSAFDKHAPQVERWIPKKTGKLTIWKRALEWLNK